jgi:23S rRNA pseudouridine2605 synthase
MPSRPRGSQQSPGKSPRDDRRRAARKVKGKGRRRPRKPALRPDDSQAAGQRLQKVLAAAGLGSRRQCEELIEQGRVEIDRQVVAELGTRVDPVAREIRVDGTVLHGRSPVYYALNKPTGVLCTNNDPSGRARAIDLVPASAGRLFSVGRLDLNSEGLILLTNDGELANRLTHPRYGVEKTYRVLVAGETAAEELEQLRRGIHLAEGVARVARVKVVQKHRQSSILEMVLDEGRNREIRRALARVGHKVLRLTRVAIGPLRLGKLKPGEFRRLSPEEVGELQGAVKRREIRDER